MESTVPAWIAVCQALLTPVIALLAIYVAWRQWRTAHSKFRLDYFNRRFPIYEAAMHLAATISSSGMVTNEQLHSFLIQTREAEFFFEDDIDQCPAPARRRHCV